jgi:hypothetical protein
MDRIAAARSTERELHGSSIPLWNRLGFPTRRPLRLTVSTGARATDAASHTCVSVPGTFVDHGAAVRRRREPGGGPVRRESLPELPIHPTPARTVPGSYWNPCWRRNSADRCCGFVWISSAGRGCGGQWRRYERPGCVSSYGDSTDGRRRMGCR